MQGSGNRCFKRMLQLGNRRGIYAPIWIPLDKNGQKGRYT